MKKWFGCILAICVISLGIGLYSKSSHTYTTILNGQNSLNDFLVTYVLTEDIIGNNESDSNREPETLPSGQSDHKIVKAEDSGQLEKGMTYIDELKHSLDEAEYVIVVKATGDNENLFGTIKQEVRVVEVCKGDSKIVGDTIYLVNPGSYFEVLRNYFLGTFVNIMQRDNQYLVFMNSIDEKHARSNKLYSLANKFNIAYFNLGDKVNNIPENADQGIMYKDVKENEFFVADEYSLKEITKFKKDIIKQYKVQDVK
jgi:hypothetical protein